MRKIAVINHKGGVGKTTITTNLGHALTLIGHHVTAIDLDPLGQLAMSYGIFRCPRKGIDQVMVSDEKIQAVGLSVRDLLTLIPAGEKLNKIDDMREGGVNRAKLLNKALDEKLIEQDYLLIDCPPSTGVLTANAIFMVEEVLIPITGDYLSLNGLVNMMIILKRFEEYLEKPLRKHIVMNKFNPRRRIANEVLDRIIKHFPSCVITTKIKEATVLAECPGKGRTIFEYRSASRSALDFTHLAEEIEMRRTA